MQSNYLLLTLCGLAMTSCAGPTDLGNQVPLKAFGGIVSVEGSPGKSFFVAKVDLKSALSKSLHGRQVDDPDILTSIAYVSGDGIVSPLVFADSNGNQLVLNADLVRQLGPTAIGVRYTGATLVSATSEGITSEETFTRSGSCLIDFSLNKAFALDDYDISDSIYANGKIYIIRNHDTAYEIDTANPSVAVPLNNPEFNPVNRIQFLVGSKLVVGSTSIDINQKFPPKQIQSKIQENGYTTNISQYNSAIVFDGLGQLWGVSVGESVIRYYRMTLDDEGNTIVPKVGGVLDFHQFDVVGSLSFPNIGNSLVGFTTNMGGNVTSSSPILVFGSDVNGHGGYVKVSGKPDGGLDFAAAANEYTLSDPPAYVNIDKVVIGDALYWISPTTTKLFKMDLLTGVQTVEYSSPSLVNSKSGALPLLTVSGDLLMFYEYEGATQISSYSLAPGSDDPKKMASFRMDITQLVELSF